MRTKAAGSADFLLRDTDALCMAFTKHDRCQSAATFYTGRSTSFFNLKTRTSQVAVSNLRTACVLLIDEVAPSEGQANDLLLDLTRPTQEKPQDAI